MRIRWPPRKMAATMRKNRARSAGKIGLATIALLEVKAKPHPEQSFRTCLCILRLARSYGSARLESACRRGDDIGDTSYGSIKSILQHRLEGLCERDVVGRAAFKGWPGGSGVRGRSAASPSRRPALADR
jgi:hypothetical protein